MKSKPTKALEVAAKYLQEGDHLLSRIPDFLRGGAQQSPNRKVLRSFVSLAGVGQVETPARPPSGSFPRRGGELLDGPERHKALRSNNPVLQPKLRAGIAQLARMFYESSSKARVRSSLTPPRQSINANRTCNFTMATIDKLFSALEDRVCTGRMITCIVVSLPCFNGSSFQFVVEDSQREPSLIALYNAPQLLISQLIPGREFRLLNPYVRIAQDGSIMLRVDDPLTTIEIKTLHVICWVCSVEQATQEQLKRCAKCHVALYCSKECQTHDWYMGGHRFL